MFLLYFALSQNFLKNKSGIRVVSLFFRRRSPPPKKQPSVLAPPQAALSDDLDVLIASFVAALARTALVFESQQSIGLACVCESSNKYLSLHLGFFVFFWNSSDVYLLGEIFECVSKAIQYYTGKSISSNSDTLLRKHTFFSPTGRLAFLPMAP